MKNSEETQAIDRLICVIHTELNELSQARRAREENDFCLGQMYAYTQCLEVLQLCPSIRSSRLNYDIEKRYPLK